MKKFPLPLPFKDSIRRLLFSRYFYLFPQKDRVSNDQLQVCCLLCHEHTPMFIHSIKSLYDSTKSVFPLLAIDDGTLTSQDIEILHENLHITILNKNVALKKILPKIKSYPYLRKYFIDKKTSIKKLKLVFLLLSSNRKILTESDILFLKPIPAINNWIAKKKLNRIHLILDEFSTDELTKMAMVDLNFRKLVQQLTQPKANYLFNGGLLFVPKELAKKDLQVLNKACKLFYEIDYIYNPYCEELLLSLLIDVKRDTALDPRFHTTVWSYKHYLTTKHSSLIHYASDTKNILESDVLKRKFTQLSRIF